MFVCLVLIAFQIVLQTSNKKQKFIFKKKSAHYVSLTEFFMFTPSSTLMTSIPATLRSKQICFKRSIEFGFKFETFYLFL